MSGDNVRNRSEIVLLYDATDCNPNGDPMDSSNRPRIDRSTEQAVVTDVRLKRYIRDQLHEDGHSILIQSPSQYYDDEDHTNTVPTRAELYKSMLNDMDPEEDDPQEILDHFLNNATDVRYFGATVSVDDDDLAEALPSNWIGPVQFGHGRSMHSVSRNDESKKLTTVVAGGEDKDQGTFADDHRIPYAMFSFNGIVNENAADYTNLTKEDVENLDTTVWRSIRNQTLTRSKFGHAPRLYMRVVYESGHHMGQLHNTLEFESEVPESEVRHVGQVTIDVSEFVDRVENNPHVEEIVMLADQNLELRNGEDVFDATELTDRIDVPVDLQDPYGE